MDSGTIVGVVGILVTILVSFYAGMRYERWQIRGRGQQHSGQGHQINVEGDLVITGDLRLLSTETKGPKT